MGEDRCILTPIVRQNVGYLFCNRGLFGNVQNAHALSHIEKSGKRKRRMGFNSFQFMRTILLRVGEESPIGFELKSKTPINFEFMKNKHC